MVMVEGSSEWASESGEAGTDQRLWPSESALRALGLTWLGLVSAGRFAGGTTDPISGPGTATPVAPVVDVTLGCADVLLEWADRGVRRLRDLVDVPVRRALDPTAASIRGPAGVAMRLLGSATRPLARRGARLRAEAEEAAARSVTAVLPGAVSSVLGHVDLTDDVVERVDIRRVMEAAFDRIDMVEFLVDRVDLAAMVEAGLDQVDLTEVALSRLDLARVVEASLDRVDAVAIARDRLDPVRVAAYLKDNVDFGETLRSAPGVVAGEAVRGMRETMSRLAGRPDR